MRFLFRVLRVLSLAWTVACLYHWLTHYYLRRGPMPYTSRWILHHPLRPLVHPVRPMLAKFGLRPGATVLELGPGTGYFSVEAARLLGASGRLVCLDIQPPMLRNLSGRLAVESVTNAHPVLGDALRLPLANASLDAAFLVSVLGEIPDRPQALAELRRVLRPGGALSISEILVDPDYQFEDTVRDLCRACGFAPREHHRGLLGYTMSFAVP